ncbi:MAG TPA: hypothetical protein VEH56_04210 [Candidatus Saccharimonadales bacterium]|nr:hypothetical protein [Candidatus Saccharimonadales bacterium]
MPRRQRRQLDRGAEKIAKGVFLLSLLTLVLLGSTILTVHYLRSNQLQPRTGWERTSQIRILMDSTADWARIMFNDLYGTYLNGVRVVGFEQHGWLSGNDSDDRVDAGFALTFVDIIYNSTVVRTGDIIGFFKGNNDFRHTRMYADVVLEVDTTMMSVSVYLMLAGAGTTTFEFIDKQSGTVIWQDTETGNSFTQYVRRSIPPDAFFLKPQIRNLSVLLLVAFGVAVIVLLNGIPRPSKQIEENATGL